MPAAVRRHAGEAAFLREPLTFSGVQGNVRSSFRTGNLLGDLGVLQTRHKQGWRTAVILKPDGLNGSCALHPLRYCRCRRQSAISTFEVWTEGAMRVMLTFPTLTGSTSSIPLDWGKTFLS